MTIFEKRLKNSVAILPADKAHHEPRALAISAPLLWYLRLARCFGHAPLRFSRAGRGWTAERHRGLLIYSWLLTITLMTCRTVAMTMQVYANWEHAMKQQLVLAMIFACVMIILLVALATLDQRTKCLLDFLGTMSKVDELSPKGRFSRCDRRLLTMLAAANTICMLIVVQIFYTRSLVAGNYRSTMLILLPYTSTLLVSLTLESCFVFTACMLDSRATALLDILDSASAAGTDMTLEKLQAIYEQQMRLRRCARQLSAGYGAPVLFALLQLMIELIYGIFLFVNELDTDWLGVLLLNIEGILNIVWWILSLVEPAHRFATKDQIITEQLGALIVRLSETSALNSDWTESAKVEILWKHHQAVAGDQIQISALDICFLRRELLAAFAGTVTTYLIILLQLK